MYVYMGPLPFHLVCVGLVQCTILAFIQVICWGGQTYGNETFFTLNHLHLYNETFGLSLSLHVILFYFSLLSLSRVYNIHMLNIFWGRVTCILEIFAYMFFVCIMYYVFYSVFSI